MRLRLTVRAQQNPDEHACEVPQQVRDALWRRKVTELRVEGVTFDDDGDFAHAAALQPLESLVLRDCSGDFGLAHIAHGLPRLRELDVSGSSDQNGLFAFVAQHTGLEVVRLVGCNAAQAVLAIARSGGAFARLRELHVSRLCAEGLCGNRATVPKLACRALDIFVHRHVAPTGADVCNALDSVLPHWTRECRSVMRV